MGIDWTLQGERELGLFWQGQEGFAWRNQVRGARRVGRPQFARAQDRFARTALGAAYRGSFRALAFPFQNAPIERIGVGRQSEALGPALGVHPEVWAWSLYAGFFEFAPCASDLASGGWQLAQASDGQPRQSRDATGPRCDRGRGDRI